MGDIIVLCPWCDEGYVGDIRSAAEKGKRLAPLAWRNHEDGCVVNAIVRDRGGYEAAEHWFMNVERYVQTYVVREALDN